MASIRKEIAVEVSADFAWSMLRQVDQAHRTFAGVLTDCRMEGDDARRRIVWITDVLPSSFLEVAGPLTEAGSAALKRMLEGQAA